MHETRGAVHLLHGVRGDVHVEFVVRGVVVRGGRARSRARALGAPTADGDASAGFSLESLLGFTAGADDQTDERVPGVFSRGDVHAQLARGRAVVSRGYVRGIERAEFVRDVAPLGVPSVPTSLFSRVDAAAGGAVVLGGRGGGSLVGWRKRNGDGGLHARGELLDARSHGERAAAASGGLVARKGAPPGADSRGARRGEVARAGNGLGARAGIDRDERAVDPRRWGGAGGSVGRCREGARFSGARIRSDTDWGRRVRGRGGANRDAARLGHLLRRRARLAAITAAMSLMVAADRAPRD